MRTIIQRLTRSKFIFASPWLLAAASGLLFLIILTFAIHNLRLEKRLMTIAMLQKASTMMRVLQSGARASYITDMRRGLGDNEPWPTHVQRVIDHLTDNPDLRFLVLVDSKEVIIAHSDHSRIGATLPLPSMDESEDGAADQPQIAFKILSPAGEGRVFQAIRPFFLNFPARMPPPAWPSQEARKRFFSPERERRGPMMHRPPENDPTGGERHFVIVGLDMDEYDRILGRFRLQIVALSLAMLFVGLGGWFSLAAVQGYRVSQKTLDDIQAFTALLIAKLPVGVIAVDAAGLIATWNENIAMLTGIDKNAAMGKPPAAILPEPLAAFFTASVVNDFGAAAEREGQLRIAFGERRCDLLCHLLVIRDSEQELQGKMLLLSDVTRIRSLEQRMRENERLAAIGRMAGGVAHEVRNPLSSIKGLALLLKNTFVPGSREENTADLLIQETERMNRAITEMLSFTRPPALHLETVDLATVVQRSLELIRAEAGEHSVITRLEQPGQPALVKGDADRLSQVIMNVFLNSIQAMSGGGELVATIAHGDEGRTIELRIADTGPGVDPELLSQVFFPYFTTKQGGTGIGLTISQKIIADHQGEMEMESEQGQGATVIIRLPAAAMHQIDPAGTGADEGERADR